MKLKNRELYNFNSEGFLIFVKARQKKFIFLFILKGMFQFHGKKKNSSFFLKLY